MGKQTRSKNEGDKFYTVAWFYLGNANVQQVKARNPKEAMRMVWFGKEEISYMVFEGKPILVRDGTKGTNLEDKLKVVN